jgi:anti-sigma B factor antagonist
MGSRRARHAIVPEAGRKEHPVEAFPRSCRERSLLWYNGFCRVATLSHQGHVVGRSTPEPSMALPTSCPPFAITVERPAPGVRVVRVAGDLDLATAPRLSSAVLDDVGCRRLVVDLSAVTFLGSTGLSALLACGEDRVLRLVGVEHRPVARPLAITGLDALFLTHSSVPEALAAIG